MWTSSLYAANYSELENILNPQNPPGNDNDYVLDIDNLESDVTTTGTISGTTVRATTLRTENYSFPTADGTDTYTLKTDGNSNVYWQPLVHTDAPSTATGRGVKGDMAYDTSYLYVCVATNQWRRVATETWLAVGVDYLLLETGDYILLESSDKIILEDGT